MIVQDGLRRMYAEQEDVFYYLTVMNENYQHPAMPEGAEERHPAGACTCSGRHRAQSGPRARRAAPGAAARQRHDPARGDRGGRPAGRGLRRRRGRVERAELHRAAPRRARRRAVEHAAPDEEPRRSATSSSAWPGGPDGPVVAATDYMKSFADQIRPFVPRRYRVLGTDGFGRSDYRRKLRAVLRGRPALRHGGRAGRAGRGGHGAGQRRSPRRSQQVRHRPRQARTRHAVVRTEGDSDDSTRPRSRSPTSATSTTSRSSRCTSSRATGSTPKTRWSRWSRTRPRWTCRRRRPARCAEVRVKVGDRVSEGTPIWCSTRATARTAAAVAGRAAGTGRPPPAAARRPPRRPARGGAGRRRRPRRPAPPPAGRARLRRGARRAERAPAGPRARRRPRRGHRHRAEGPDHQGRPARRSCAGPAPAAGRGRAGRRRAGIPEIPAAGLLQVRPGRDQAAVPDQEAVRAVPAPVLAERPARHPQRRGRHHRARRATARSWTPRPRPRATG